PEQVIVTELGDRSSKVILTTAAKPIDLTADTDVLPVGGDSVRIGLFKEWRDSLAYAVSAPVKGSAGADQLFVVRWRRIVMREQTRTAINNIFGTWGTPYLGNPNGTGWVDFRDKVPKPPVDFAS